MTEDDKTKKKAKKTNYDTVKQIRVSQELFEKANEVFSSKGLSFSEAVRMFLEQTAIKKRMPFRCESLPDWDETGKMAAEEANFVYDYLGINLNGETAEEKILRVIFGEGDETSEHMTDADLQLWAKRVGIDPDMDINTLADIYDSRILPHDPYEGEIKSPSACGTPGYCSGHCPTCAYSSQLISVSLENAKRNLAKAFDKMLINSTNQFMIECGAIDEKIEDANALDTNAKENHEEEEK